VSYATITSVLQNFPKLPQTSTAAGYSVTVQVVGNHVTRSDALVDAYVAKRYALPLSKVPPILRAVSDDICTYYTFRSFFTQDNSNRIDYFAELKNDALETLKMIGNGDLQLVDTSGAILPFLTDYSIESTTDRQTFFDIDNSMDWEFNSDLVDEVKDGR
jgi:phage gp36-like protein